MNKKIARLSAYLNNIYKKKDDNIHKSEAQHIR